MSLIKEKLAAQLAEILDQQPEPLAQVATRIGMTRQRLHQLKSADKSASIDAITDALGRLGYEIDTITLKQTESPSS